MKQILEYAWVLYMAAGATTTFWAYSRNDDALWIGVGLAFVALGYPIYRGKRHVEYRMLLKVYEERLEPIYEWQQTPDDDGVYERSQEHQLLLKESGNKHFENGRLAVVTFYFQDPDADYCETWEAYEQRVQDAIKDHKRHWAKQAFGGDELKRIQFLHRQRVEQPEPTFVFHRVKNKEVTT